MAHAKINVARMYDWIEHNLNQGIALPADAQIMERFGFDSPESARTLLAELADAGRITIKGYGETRTITLGRTKATLTPAPRPVPTAKKADPVIDAGVAKIAAIVARGGNAGSARAAQAADALKAVRTKPALTKAPAVNSTPKASVATLPTKEAVPLKKPVPSTPPIETATSPTSDSAPTLDGLFQMIRQHVQRAGHHQSSELAAAVARTVAAEARADAAEGALARIKAALAS